MRFGDYSIDRARWQLRHREEVLPLSRKTFDLLLYLVEHTDRVVSKEEILRALWPDSFVEESNLTQHVFLLRKALSRHESGIRIIETVPGRGYRFAVPVEKDEPKTSIQDLAATTTPDLARNPLSGRESAAAGALAVQSSEASVAASSSGGPGKISAPGRNPAVRVSLLALTFALPILLAAWLYVRRQGVPPPQEITKYTMITHDGHAKLIGGTDGSRVYFTRLDNDEIAQVSIAGGVEAPLPLPIQLPRSGDVSPDGSTLLLISQAHGQGPANSLWSVHLVGGALHLLASAITAAWSPDGESIVYASAGGDLLTMRRDGSDKHPIASPGGYIQSIAWSPDGTLIRFARDGLLWEMTPRGGGLKQLLPGWGGSPTQWNGAWAKDGRYFFVADGQIWVLGGEKNAGPGGHLHPSQLTFGPMLWDRPLPSLDEKLLFASGRVRRGELVCLDQKTQHFDPSLAGISAEFVAFSSAAHAVAYVSYPEGHLWRANLDGSNPTQLTDASVYPKSIRWSPDGFQIAFVNRAENNLDAIYLIPADGSGHPYRLMPNDLEAETDPSWSADGKQIAFSTSPNVGASARSDLRTFDLAQGKVAVIPASDGFLAPRWSPDGHLLAAMTLDTEKLAILDRTTGKWTLLPTGHLAFPEWSRDGQWVYYVGWDPTPALKRIRASDGHRETIVPLGAVQYTGSYTLWMGLDPDDRPMLLRDEGSDDIYALTLAGY